MTATHPFTRKILLAFDFDWTLAEDSFERLVVLKGFDVDEWKSHHMRPLSEAGWDEILAKFEGLRRMCVSAGKSVTLADVQEAGRSTKGFPGAETMPERLRAVARTVDPSVEPRIRHRLGRLSRCVFRPPRRAGFRPALRIGLRHR
ncbi:hypothetical protein [Jiella pelagia]|uniref:Haloacid dehalogenase-like hydrolase n=1 Tax=Jiella pelagia TaxID=2986949 RepID=A0ABY7C0G6_9HYPH|nr:hypothetical protein [Jiella pelagia]WAP69513.1 hypothetical protein OH818_04480 [Jiella pelagia]